MNIEVRLFASFRKNRWKSKYITIDRDTTIQEIIEQIKIKEEELGIVLVNGIHSDINTVLKSNDVLALFPPLGGG